MRTSAVTILLVGLFARFASSTVEKVLTPGGYRTKSTIHAIPAGGSLAHVGSEVHIIAANGTVVHKAGTGAPTSKRAVLPRSLLTDSWISWAGWVNPGPSPIASFKTTWEVPPIPTAERGQTVFLFNSLLPNESASILQPVLQYGPSDAGGGPFWTVATWYIDDNENAFFTAPIRTSPGATLNGIITLTSINGSQFNYNAQFTNIPGTSLNVTGAKQLSLATETLEAYSIAEIDNYPAGATVFSGIDLELADGATPGVEWQSVDNDARDGLVTTINRDGATDAQITITY
ncbi:hypothetical protein B0H19DRAFT_1057271 [Mycena capillaripes]|nr:hypothetical protein B0H19DRAFT_1057271 [Mycena capillaripes]